jgi:hypothetical protein
MTTFLLCTSSTLRQTDGIYRLQAKLLATPLQLLPSSIVGGVTPTRNYPANPQIHEKDKGMGGVTTPGPERPKGHQDGQADGQIILSVILLYI